MGMGIRERSRGLQPLQTPSPAKCHYEGRSARIAAHTTAKAARWEGKSGQFRMSMSKVVSSSASGSVSTAVSMPKAQSPSAAKPRLSRIAIPQGERCEAPSTPDREAHVLGHTREVRCLSTFGQAEVNEARVKEISQT